MKWTAWPLCVCLALAHGGAFSAPVSGIDTSGFDPGIRFQDDLYGAANGRWVSATTIPPDHASYGSFTILHDKNEKRNRQLIEGAVRQPASAEERKLADLYLSFMDVAMANKRGTAPLANMQAQIAGVEDIASLTRLMGAWQATIVDLPLGHAVTPDAGAPSKTLLQINQAGLGLPDRDYYLQSGARFVAARQAYLTYLTRLFTLADRRNATARAQAVMALETRIAQAQWDNVANRDPVKTYNPLTRAQLQQTVPTIDWPRWFDGACSTS